MTLYVALVRGINVGGKNIVAMPALKACFEALKLRDVATYIQSGNVIFGADRGGAAAIATRIERGMAGTFACTPRVTLRSHAEMQAVVDDAPRGFGKDTDAYRYDVIFLIPPLTPADALAALNPKPGVDRATPGDGVLYVSRLVSKASQSRLQKVVGTPAYRLMTIRNWNTTTTLLALMSKRRSIAG